MIETKNEDSLERFASLDDWKQLCEQHCREYIQNNPIEVVNSLRKMNLITDEEYKEMITNIRTVELEGDFT